MTDEVTVKFDMFGLFVENRITGDVNDRLDRMIGEKTVKPGQFGDKSPN